MTQHTIDYTGNPSGANLLDVLLTDDRSNELTSNSGTARPAYAISGTVWLDTTSSPWVWKMFNGTNDIIIGTLNPTSLIFTPSGLPALTAAGTSYSPAYPLTATNVQDGINQVVAIINALNTVFLPLAGGTLTGKLITIAGATGTASINIPQGSTPSSPVNGDIWTTAVGIFARINGSIRRLDNQNMRINSSVVSTFVSGTGVFPNDDSIPEITEGNEFLTISHTPNSSANRLLIRAVIYVSTSLQDSCTTALFQDSTVNALAATKTHSGYSGAPQCVVLEHDMLAGTTSPITFRIRCGATTGTTYLNSDGNTGNRKLGGVSSSRITITEYTP